MNVLIIGTEEQRAELISSLPDTLLFAETKSPSLADLEKADCIFDLNLDNETERLEFYSGLEDCLLVVSAVKCSLSEYKYIANLDPALNLVGLNSLKGFVNRPLKELSFASLEAKKAFDKWNKNFLWQYQEVGDRVGMISPRVILMIINEACYTLQEGTAEIAAIDQAMKLGTNYPKGPFEWADEIGIADVYETLEAIFEDTGDVRYKICPLLKKYYLQEKSFYA